MTNDRWAQVDRVVQSALGQPAADREAYVRGACGDDTALRDEVLSLLAHSDSAEGFLEPPSARPSAVGALVGRTLGRYRLLELVGAGGMGEVYRARDQRLDRDVAVKVLPEAVVHDPHRLARFEREARALAKLEHPNILAIHDIGSEGGVTFTVTELLHGETLRARLGRERLSWRKAAELAAAIADGLTAAHAQGVIHRDIKPENLFLMTDGRVKILDFGLAATGPTVMKNLTTATEHATGRTPPGTVLGTVGYMSPEQVQSGEVSARSDIFALGCVLYEMLTGRQAFDRPTASETLAAILAAPVPDLAANAPDAPLDLSRIVHRCVEKQPDERFQSTPDLAFALRATLATASGTAAASSGAETAAAPASTPAVSVPASRPSRRRFVMAGVIGLLIIVVAIAAAQRWWSNPAASNLDGNKKFVVAVFRNQTGDTSLDALGFLISENVTNGLSRLSGVQVALNPDVSSGGVEMPATPAAIGRRTSAGLVIDGSYYMDGPNLRIEARIIEAASGRNVMTFDPISGLRANPGNAVQELTSRAMGAVAWGASSKADLGTALGLARAPRYEALQERVLGSRHLYIDNTEARRHYLRALEIDPDYFEPKLGMVISTTDPVEKDKWLKAIVERYAMLAPWQQARYLVLRAGLDGRRAEAITAAEQLVRLDSTSATFLNDLLLTLGQAKYLRRALATAERVRPVAPPREFSGAAGSWINWMAKFQHALGDDTAALESAREGQQRYPQDGFFFENEIIALVGLGRVQEIEPVITRVAAAALRSSGMGEILGTTSRELRAHGYRDQSIAIAKRGVEFRRAQLDPREPTRGQRSNVAANLMRAERWEEAFSIYATLVREVPASLAYQGQLGVVAARLGKHTDARRIAEALAQVDRPFLLGEHQFQRARVLAALGAREDAMTALQLAYGKGRPWTALEIHQDLAFEPIADYPPFIEFLKSKD